MNKYAVWFGRAIWLGILADWVLCLPAIFAPNWTLELFGQQPAVYDAHWVAFAALLVVLLSFFYLPAALDPYHYSVAAWLAVLARFSGVVFFLWLYPAQYPAFGIVDLVLFLIQAPPLIPALRTPPPPPPPYRPPPT